MKEIKRFKKISWEEIPDIGLYSDQVLEYLENRLISYFPNTMTISSSMINNYVKNGLIPKPLKKKYYRAHIAHLIVVIVLKQTMSIKKIKDGMGLQTRIMDVEKSYDEFMDILENSYNNILNSIDEDGKMTYGGFVAERKNLALTLAINAFCFQTITNHILDEGGIYFAKEEK